MRPVLASLLSLVAAVLFAEPGAYAQGCAPAPPYTLGQVVVLDPNGCPSGTGSLADTTCMRLEVRCGHLGLPPIGVEVRISEPPAGVPLRGTVVFGTGAGGDSFYAEHHGGSGRPLLEDLQALGFRVVDRRWEKPWFGDGGGMLRQSCRYATLLDWVYRNVHTAGAFCATGNSGGSGEIGYALTTWGLDAVLDVAVPTSGPPMARLDYMCLDPPGWQALCASLIPPYVMDVQPACVNTDPNHPSCIACSTSATLQDLEEDSILHPNATLHFPTTRVHQVIGSMDDKTAVPMGLLFHEAVSSEAVVEFVPGGTHWIAETRQGRDAVLRAILGGAACAPGPASMQAREWPVVGGTLELDLLGQAGATYAIHRSLATTLTPAPGLGWLFLAQPITQVAAGTLDPWGQAYEAIPVPNRASLAGRTVYLQARLGACLSNLVTVEVQP